MFRCSACSTWFSNINAIGRPECPRCAAMAPFKEALGLSEDASEADVLVAVKRARGFEEIFSMDKSKREQVERLTGPRGEGIARSLLPAEPMCP